MSLTLWTCDLYHRYFFVHFYDYCCLSAADPQVLSLSWTGTRMVPFRSKAITENSLAPRSLAISLPTAMEPRRTLSTISTWSTDPFSCLSASRASWATKAPDPASWSATKPATKLSWLKGQKRGQFISKVIITNLINFSLFGIPPLAEGGNGKSVQWAESFLFLSSSRSFQDKTVNFYTSTMTACQLMRMPPNHFIWSFATRRGCASKPLKDDTSTARRTAGSASGPRIQMRQPNGNIEQKKEEKREDVHFFFYAIWFSCKLKEEDFFVTQWCHWCHDSYHFIRAKFKIFTVQYYEGNL